MIPCQIKKEIQQAIALVFDEVKLTAILFIIAVLTVSGCGEQTTQPLKSLVKPKTSKTVNEQPAADVSSISIEGTSQEMETVYTYMVEGRRDPFKSLLLGLKEKKSSGLTPLQQRSLSELKVIGIMWEDHGHTAMIETPDGKGYWVKEGALVGPDGGFIQKITEDSIVIEEGYTDYYGKKRSKKTMWRLHAKEEGSG